MKKTVKKTLSGIIVAIAILAGITAGAEAATWLDSIAVEAPTKVAVDNIGRVYVTEENKNRLSTYDNKGNLVKVLYGLQHPVSIAVDTAGKIYIGSKKFKDSSGKTYNGNVKIYNPDYTLWKTIGGVDPAEIIQPNAIGLTGNGNIYIIDSYQHKVMVYAPDGSALFTFGGYDAGTRDPSGNPIAGSAEGKFNVPLDIAIDETAGELYIIDLGVFISYDESLNPQLQRGARVQVFDMYGNVIKPGRTFGTWGTGNGEMKTPAGIAIDQKGVLNITDTALSTVHRFNRYGVFIEKISGPDDPENPLPHPLNIPTGIAVGQDERMYIVSSGSTPKAVEIYGLEDYTSLAVTPKEINLSGYAGGTAAGQDITISNSGPGDMHWDIQRASGSEWITLSKETGETGGTTSEAVTAGADLSSLAAGTYTGKFKVITGGAEEEVTVNLQVNTGGSLEVTPLELTYTGQAGGSQPGAHIVTITLTGGAINWTAQSNAQWLSIDPEAGSAGAAVQASVTVDTTGLAAGQYNSSITITASGSTGSPAEVSVKLILISAGKIEVTTNIEEAKWDISGAATYQGSGTQWSRQDAPSGQYQISFEEVIGYVKPQDQTFTVQSGNITAIDVNYKDLRALKKIIAGLGPGNKNPAEIKILNTEGTLAGADFTAFSLMYGVNVAAGDIDGDGIDEIIAGAGANKNNPARAKVFKADGSEIPGADFIAFTTKYGVNIAAGDIDGDGKAEIITGKGIGSGNSTNIRVFKNVDGVITDTGINNIVDTSRYGVYVAAGDLDGDGKDEIITGTGPDKNAAATVRILKADTSAGIGSWSAAQTKAITVNGLGIGAVVAAGDLNADGRAEILAGSSYRDYRYTLNIKTYNADGSAYGVAIAETNTYKSKAPSIAAGDTDADGTAEIIIGAGADRKSPAEIRIYSAAGAFINSFTAFSELGGVNVCVGKVE